MAGACSTCGLAGSRATFACVVYQSVGLVQLVLLAWKVCVKADLPTTTRGMTFVDPALLIEYVGNAKHIT